MKTTFQAKDIREMLGIPRQRYDYLAKYMGITPEIEEVKGKGKVQLYSFRNALEFAIAQYMGVAGIGNKGVREGLDYLRSLTPSSITDELIQFADELGKDPSNKLAKLRGLVAELGELVIQRGPELFSRISSEGIFDPAVALPDNFTLFFTVDFEIGELRTSYFAGDPQLIYEIHKDKVESVPLVAYTAVRLDTIKARVLSYASG